MKPARKNVCLLILETPRYAKALYTASWRAQYPQTSAFCSMETIRPGSDAAITGFALNRGPDQLKAVHRITALWGWELRLQRACHCLTIRFWNALLLKAGLLCAWISLSPALEEEMVYSSVPRKPVRKMLLEEEDQRNNNVWLWVNRVE